MRRLLCAAIVLCTAATGFAQDEIVASFQYTSSAPTIDGMGDDAVWANATTQPFEDFFELPGDSPDEGDGDLEVSFKALWDDANLYLYVEVTDDEIINEDSLNWQDDSVEFYIDAQNLDVENFQPDMIDIETDEEQRFPAYQITGIAGCNIDEICGERIRDDSTSVFTWGINSYDRGDPTFEEDDELVTYPRGADTSVSLIDGNTWTYEVAFPWEALFDTPENIKERGSMGFGMAINDDDDEGGRDAQWMWQTEAGDLWNRSDTFPSVELIGGADDGVAGDFNDNGERDPGDLDLLAAAMDANDAAFDLNDDGQTNQADRQVWLETLSNTYYGDSNFDGEFNSSDFVAVFGAAKYETGQPANWSEGDWNGDGVFSSSDFVTAFSGGGYEQGARDGGLMTVPEPSGLVLVMMLLGALHFRYRRS